MLRTCCVHTLFFVVFRHSEQYLCTQHFAIFMYWAYNSMSNLLSYCGLVDARISASEKDLPVVKFVSCMQRGGGVSFHNRN